MQSEFDDIDRLMTADDTIVPSSGFASEVLAAVRASVESPPPPRFPWGRFSLGIGTCLLWAAAGLTVLGGVDLSLPPIVGFGRVGDTAHLLQLAAVVAIATLAVLRTALPASRR